jgi:hypothetical protein
MVSSLAPLGAFTFLMGGAFTAGQLRLLWRGLQSRSWPSVQGRVVASSVLVDADPRTHFHGYGARIVCSYRVRGEGREAKALDFHSFSSELERVYARTRRYAAGSAVTVWYDPMEPSRITLRPGVGVGPVLGALAGVAVLAMGCWVLATAAAW